MKIKIELNYLILTTDDTSLFKELLTENTSKPNEANQLCESVVYVCVLSH